jgi:hypothetical protein
MVLNLFSSLLISFLGCVSGMTVSGVSSGGFVAVQMHVAFSSEVSSSGIVAGGPYLCENILACTSHPELINVDILEATTRSLALGGYIDATSFLSRSEVYLYSGTLDTVVDPRVVKKLSEYYSRFGSRIFEKYDVASEHGWPTESYGVPCRSLRIPFINHCNFSFSRYMFGEPLSGEGSLIKLPQINGPLISMGEHAYAFIPKNITGKSLHVSFHGCEQTIDDIGLDFIKHSGLNEHGMIVIYPQVIRTPLNPYGCWDWWGYTGIQYPTKLSPQMNLVMGIARYYSEMYKNEL